MNYLKFKNYFQEYPLIASKDVLKIYGNNQAVHNQLNRWQKRGLILKLRKGLYLLNKNERRVSPGQMLIANNLYQPSYVSLEHALSFCGLIPERSYTVTSVTTKKTAHFKNMEGDFSYQHIKPQAFRGFREMKDPSGCSVFIAEPEKAVVDFLYLNLRKFRVNPKEALSDSFRFQNIEDLRQKRLLDLARLFRNRKLFKVVKDFCGLIRSSNKHD